MAPKLAFVPIGLAAVLAGCGADTGSTRVEPTPPAVINPGPATNVGEPPEAGGSPDNVNPQSDQTPGSARSGTSTPAVTPRTTTRATTAPALPKNPLKPEKP